MGIPKFYNQFNTTFNIVYPIRDHTKLTNITHVIFDFNSIIYNAIDELLYHFEEHIAFIKSNPDFEDMICDYIVIILNKHIQNIVNTQIQKFVLAIFIDGIPSLNKMNEQRHRKIFGTIAANIESLVNYAGKEPILWLKLWKWSANKGRYISPGTKFMEKLENKFRQLQITNFIISYSSDREEAEIKLMRYLYNIYDKKDNYIIISPDADLILLTMRFVSNNINVVKIGYDNGLFSYNLIDISKFMTLLQLTITSYIELINDLEDSYPLPTSKQNELHNMSFITNILQQIIQLTDVEMQNKMYQKYKHILVQYIGNNDSLEYLQLCYKNRSKLNDNDSNDIILDEHQIKIHKLIEKYNKLYPHLFNLRNLQMLHILFNDISFIESIKQFQKIKTISINNTAIIEDLILIFILFGNDFVPKILCIDLDETVIHWILFLYSVTLFKNHSKSFKYLLNNGNIDYFGFLCSLLGELRTIEYNFIMNNQYTFVINNPLIIKSTNPFAAIKCNNKYNPYSYFDISNMDPCFANRLQSLHFFLKQNKCDFDEMCMCYLDSFQWIKYAYFDHQIKQWIYPLLFSPSIFMLHDFLSKNKYKIVELQPYQFENITADLQYLLVNPFDYENNEWNKALLDDYTNDENKKAKMLKQMRLIDGYYVKNYGKHYYLDTFKIVEYAKKQLGLKQEFIDNRFICLNSKFFNGCKIDYPLMHTITQELIKKSLIV